MANKKILVVDDEPGIVRNLALRLKAAGYEVATGSSGEEALSQVKAENPDLILLDVMMPPPNGYQVCRTLKDDPNTKNIPVVLLTAKGSESDKFWGEESGSDAYVTKPYNHQDLMTKIAELLNG